MHTPRRTHRSSFPRGARFVTALLWALAFFLRPDVSSAKWEMEMEAFAAKDTQSPFAPDGILFVGSSSIRLWAVEKAFPEHRVLNRGFGGSQIRDSIDWFDRVILPHHPRMIVFYAGGNDIHSGKTAQTVISDARELFQKIHAAFPETRVLYISIAPNPARWKQIDTVREANTAIRAMAGELGYVHFVDMFSSMLGEDGLPLPHIFRADRLHMNESGYEIWNRILKPLLESPGR
jgi:lysophospholipase L1-like esterase